MPLVTKTIGGQLRPADTAAAAILTVANLDPVRRWFFVQQIVVCNTTGTAATYSIYFDADGSTYDADTALVSGTSLAANTTVWLEVNLAVPHGGTLGVQSGTGNAINFTIFGEEEPA